MITIIFRFFEPGHSLREIEVMHSRIESSCQFKELFTQADCCEAMETAGHRYNVREIGPDQIFDYKILADCFTWRDIEISKIREITVRPGSEKIAFKNNFQRPLREIEIFKGNFSIEDITNFKLAQAYFTLFRLSLRKLQKLRLLLLTSSIPAAHAWFFELLMAI